jgi:LPS export ABC transporter protein LptC
MVRFGHIVICLFSALIFYNCTNDMRDVQALAKPKIKASQVGDSVTMIYTDSAKLKLMVKANRMLLFDKDVSEPFTVLPKGVYVTFFDEEEKVSATLRANYGVRYDNSGKMMARNDVQVVNRKGEKLETEKLTWDEKQQRIYTDAFVKITSDKQVIMGTGMESNQDFSKYEIKKVTGILHINDNSDLKD